MVDPTATTDQVLVGENVTVETVVRNPTGVERTVPVEVAANGEPILTESVTVSPNDSRTISLTVSFDHPGDYRLTVNEHSAGTVTVYTEDPIENERLTPHPDRFAGENAPGFGIVTLVLGLLLVARRLARR